MKLLIYFPAIRMTRGVFLFIFLSGSATHAINPSREYVRTPDTYGLAYTQYTVQTTDNYAINVWEYGLPDSVHTKRVVIFAGTDAGNMSNLIAHAKLFVDKGIRVVAFDYRGFGKSSDFTINKDFLYYPEFAIDLDTVIKSTRAKYRQEKIGVYALSMGTYISMLRTEKIDFLVAEGFYIEPARVVARLLAIKGKTVLLPSMASRVSDTFTPVLIFCASKDQITTPGEARSFSEKFKPTIVEFEGDHLGGVQVMTNIERGDLYMKSVVSFLDAHKL